MSTTRSAAISTGVLRMGCAPCAPGYTIKASIAPLKYQSSVEIVGTRARDLHFGEPSDGQAVGAGGSDGAGNFGGIAPRARHGHVAFHAVDEYRHLAADLSG